MWKPVPTLLFYASSTYEFSYFDHQKAVGFFGVPVLQPLRLHYNACQMDGRMLATGRLAPDVPQHVLASLGRETLVVQSHQEMDDDEDDDGSGLLMLMVINGY